MKKISLVLAVVLIASAFVFSACGNNGGGNTSLSVTELWAKANEAAGFGAMTAVPKGDWSDIYGVDTSKVEEAAWYMSENPSLNADEMAIFKLNDASYAETLAGIFRSRIARQLEVAKAYSPDEAKKLETAEVVVAGNYVYYCVGTANSAVVTLMKSLIK